MFPTLLASVVSGEAMIALKRLRSAVLVYMLAAFLLLAGVGFLVGAGYVAAQARLGSFYASLYFGIGFVVAAVVIMGIFRIYAGWKVKSARKRRATETKALVSAAAIAALPALLSARRGPMIGLPLVGALAYLLYREWRPPRDEPKQ